MLVNIAKNQLYSPKHLMPNELIQCRGCQVAKISAMNLSSSLCRKTEGCREIVFLQTLEKFMKQKFG